MYYKRRRRHKVRKLKFRRKKRKEFGKKTYVRNRILQFGDRRKIRGGAFPISTLFLIALKAVSVLLWNIEEKLKEKNRGVVGYIRMNFQM